MPEFLQNIDVAIFYFINHTLSNSLFDKIMPFITEVDSWVLVYLVGFYFLLFKSGKIGKITALALILTIIATDQINSSILKEMVGRIRPCHTLEDVNLLVGCGGGKSFPSSHAANNFAAATVIVYYFRKNYLLFYSIAFLVALSRVYVGVHYPIDITAGAIVGGIIGFLVALIIDSIFKKFNT
jgi:undecaprenyl-diphosphatase